MLRTIRESQVVRRMEGAMAKAFQGEAVLNIPRTLNNAGHGALRLARRVKSFHFEYNPVFLDSYQETGIIRSLHSQIFYHHLL